MPNIFFKGDRVTSKNRVRSYVNPKAFDPTPPPEKSFIKFSPLFIKLTLAVMFVGILGWLLLTSSVFKVKNIEIKGDAGDETKLAIETLRNKNIFLIGGKKAEREIAKKQPGIKNINIVRGIPHTLIISLVERGTAVLWVSNGKTYLTDKDGIAFKESDTNYPKIIDNKNLPVKIGDHVASASFINYILRIYSIFPTELNFGLDQVVVPETTYQVELSLKDRPLHIKLETTRPIEEQIADIKYVLANHKDQSVNLIDIRIPGFAYVK